MSDQLALSVPEVEAFWLVRGGGSIKIEPCPDGASAWHWQMIPTEPMVRMVPTGMVELGPAGELVPQMHEVEIMPEVLHVDTDQLLANVTLDEARLFLGYCAHLHEHLFTHIGTCIETLRQAWDERRFSGIEQLSCEVVAAERIRAMTSQAMRTLYDKT